MAARRQVTRTVTVPAPLEDVWSSVVAPEGLAGWLGTGADLRSTGPGKGELRELDGTVRTIRVEASTFGRLVFWWCPRQGGDGDVSRVEVTLAETGGGTLVTVTETALADAEGPRPAAADGDGPVPTLAGMDRT